MLKRSRFIPSNYFIALLISICAASCGGGGGGSSSLDQTPIARPPTVTLTSSAEVIELGESFTLNWSAVSSTTCQASVAWDGNKGNSGAQSVSPSSVGVYRYVLTCSNSDGQNDGPIIC